MNQFKQSFSDNANETVNQRFSSPDILNICQCLCKEIYAAKLFTVICCIDAYNSMLFVLNKTNEIINNLNTIKYKY